MSQITNSNANKDTFDNSEEIPSCKNKNINLKKCESKKFFKICNTIESEFLTQSNNINNYNYKYEIFGNTNEIDKYILDSQNDYFHLNNILTLEEKKIDFPEYSERN